MVSTHLAAAEREVYDTVIITTYVLMIIISSSFFVFLYLTSIIVRQYNSYVNPKPHKNTAQVQQARQRLIRWRSTRRNSTEYSLLGGSQREELIDKVQLAGGQLIRSGQRWNTMAAEQSKAEQSKLRHVARRPVPRLAGTWRFSSMRLRRW